ncbi:hypothetical protein M758_UG302100 [Ceratodon purpureus]|nr:hypothetical protein M758_UG302100 [Ceratodon purpureus]
MIIQICFLISQPAPNVKHSRETFSTTLLTRNHDLLHRRYPSSHEVSQDCTTFAPSKYLHEPGEWATSLPSSPGFLHSLSGTPLKDDAFPKDAKIE